MGAKQGTTQPLNGENYGTGTGAKGSSDKNRLAEAYASSPVTNQSQASLQEDGSLGSAMRQWYQDNVLSGKQDKNGLFGEVDMDYGIATNTADVETGGEGKPAGTHVPNTASPGEGNEDNPTSIPAIPPVEGHGGSLGSVQSPSDSSATQGGFSLTNLPAAGKSPA